MSTARKKKDNIHIRVEPEQKAVISKAATSLGLDLSSFVLQHSLKAAREELAEVETYTLSKQDSEAFLEALVTPPAPNKQLKDAYKQYNNTFGLKE